MPQNGNQTRRAVAGASVIPLPGLDIGTDVSILLALLPAINERFGLSEQQLAQLHPNRKKYTFYRHYRRRQLSYRQNSHPRSRQPCA
ncbi:hypothetical protein [Sodalis glossinidius]|uniref:hypothetical protein n=1 Tax=Sodalis glossinidius TaxID=63612 RepID=UPI0003062F52|nr:hypothetical protein [Sodalis glossinidius]